MNKITKFEDIIFLLDGNLEFKNKTEKGDILVILLEEMQGAITWAIVQDIVPIKDEKEYVNISLKLLSIPLKDIVWKAKLDQINGNEVFTDENKSKRFMKPINLSKKDCPDELINRLKIGNIMTMPEQKYLH